MPDAHDDGAPSVFVAKLASEDAHDQSSAFDRVYQELRSLARRYMRRERAGHTLQPTELVNEACLRLIPSVELDAATHDRLLCYGARAMRQVLTDHARRGGAQRRGGGWGRITLFDVADDDTARDVDLLALDHALTWLEKEDPRLARMTEWHYFAGMTGDQVARQLGISRSTVTRELSLARALLLREIDRHGSSS